MSSYRWPDMSLTALGIKVHEYALQNGRCVVFVHGHMVHLRSATDARNTRDADDDAGTFTARDSHEHIHKCLLSAMLASKEDTRG